MVRLVKTLKKFLKKKKILNYFQFQIDFQILEKTKILFSRPKKKIKLSKRIDIVIHCANKHYNSPGKGNFYKENIQITKNINEFCNTNKIKKLIFLSSVDVYGNPNKDKETFYETSRLNPQNWYARSKVLSEKIFSQKKIFINLFL